MLFSFMLATESLDRNMQVKVIDGDISHTFTARKGQKEHFYTNIPVKTTPRIQFDLPHQLEQLSTGGNVYFTEAQKRVNRTLIRDRNVRYRVSVNGKPRQAIVTFAPGKGAGGWMMPYPVLNAELLGMEDVVIISLQDCYFTSGSYFISDNFGKPPAVTLKDVIARILHKYEIDEQNLYLLGHGKGANSAVIVSNELEKNKLILLGYQPDLIEWLKTSHHQHLLAAIDRLGIPFPDTFELLKQESWKKETHYFHPKSTSGASKRQQLVFDTPNLFQYFTESSIDRILETELEQVHQIIKE